MSQKEQYDALVKRLATLMKAMRNTGTPGRDQPTYEDVATTVLSIVASALADVTEEMVEAWRREDVERRSDAADYAREAAGLDWRAMLSASALVSGREG